MTKSSSRLKPYKKRVDSEYIFYTRNSKYIKMTWQLSDNWAVKRDPHNWVLQERSGKRWRSVGYYRTPEQLLHCLYEKLLLSELAEPRLIDHVEHCQTVVEACTARLSQCIHTSMGGKLSKRIQPRSTKPKKHKQIPENLPLDLRETSQ